MTGVQTCALPIFLGKNNASAIGTLVERTTRLTLLLHLPGDHSATTVRDAIIDKITTLPHELRKSLAWDQGHEMARHQQISIAADIDVFFCDPASPWQRGTNENTVPYQEDGRISGSGELGVEGSTEPRWTSSGLFQARASCGLIVL